MFVKPGKYLISCVTAQTILAINRDISFKGTVTRSEHPSWPIKLGHASFHCTSGKLNSTWLMKRNSAKCTEIGDHRVWGVMAFLL